MAKKKKSERRAERRAARLRRIAELRERREQREQRHYSNCPGGQRAEMILEEFCYVLHPIADDANKQTPFLLARLAVLANKYITAGGDPDQISRFLSHLRNTRSISAADFSMVESAFPNDTASQADCLQGYQQDCTLTMEEAIELTQQSRV